MEGISINYAFNNPWCITTKAHLRMRKPTFKIVSLNCYIHSLQIGLFALSLLRMPKFKVGGGGVEKIFQCKKIKKRGTDSFMTVNKC